MALDCKILIVSRILPGSILFTSNPPGADIYLDVSGNIPVYTGLQTPNAISNLPKGDYDFIIRLPGHNDHKGTITVKAGETTPVVVFLETTKHPLVPIMITIPLIVMIIDSLI